MKDKAKPIVKPVNKQLLEQEQKSQNKFFLVMSFVFLFALLVSFMVPVYYVPLFKNISSRYGLSADITRKLTLLDLALNSFGIETPNMAAAFKKHDIEYEPDVFYTSRFFETGTNSRLINAKETYYHEYERTKKRPAEIAGIYQDKTAVNTPEIDGDLKGVRALPEDDYWDNFGDDDSFTDFSYKKASATTASKDDVMGSKRRQVRGSFDRQGSGAQITQGQEGAKKHEPLPDFASSIYDQNEEEETQTLQNSRMVKPIVSGQDFTVIKPEGGISKLVGDSSFTDTFAALSNFGIGGGALGYYVKDDLPKAGLFNFFGDTGKEMFSSYFYSHAAVGRKYVESSKHFAEIAFHGDEPQDEILVAKGQKENKAPTLNENEISPLTLLLTVKRNMKECEDGRKRYEQAIRPLLQQYENAKRNIIHISEDENNEAWRGVPGSCDYDTECIPTIILRNSWNANVDKAIAKCKKIREEGIKYANACKMNYTWDTLNNDSCEQIQALKLDGGEHWFELEDWFTEESYCRVHVKWKNLGTAKNFDKCGSDAPISLLHLVDPDDNELAIQSDSRRDCVTKITNLFEKIDTNIRLEAQPGFVFD